MTAFVTVVLMLFLALLTVADLLPVLAGPPVLPDQRTQSRASVSAHCDAVASIC